MSEKLFIKLTKHLSVFALVFFCAASVAVAQENSSVNVKSNVSATANTGGNTISGGGTIKTGNASASAKAVTTVDGEDKDVENKVEAKAQTQNGGTASVEVNGEKKDCAAGDGETCQVEIDSDKGTAQAAVQGAEVQENDGRAATDTPAEEQNIFQKVYGMIGGIFDKLADWL